MALIAYYVVFMVLGDIADYVIGLGVEDLWPDAKQASLIIFLALYFLFLWIAWLLAVKFTEPKKTATSTS
jgi:membrane protein implicated in regulation of membrane protease activity